MDAEEVAMMPDREKVIKRLGKVSYYFKSLLAVGWQGDADIYREHMESVNMGIALLKEQEAMKPIYNEQKYGSHLPHCGNCEKVLPNNAVYGKVNFCHYCGKAVKWNV